MGPTMSAVTAQLSGSAFIANLGPGEKSIARFLLTLLLGAVAFVMAAVVGVFVSFGVLIAFAGWPAPTDLAHLQSLLRRFLDLVASDGRSLDSALQIMAVAIPDNVFPIFAVIGVAALVHQRPLGAFATSAPRFRWRLLIGGLALSLLIIGPYMIIGQWLDPKATAAPLLTVSRDNGLRALYVVACIVAFLPAALGEEMLFRGWLLRQTSGVFRNPAVLIVLNGVVFAAAHLQFAPDAFLERLILGAAFAYMTLRLGGIEFSTGAHFANNLIVVLLFEPLTLRAPPSNPVTIDVLAEYAFLLGSFIVMTEIIVRWTPLRRWTGADRATPPATAAAEPAS